MVMDIALPVVKLTMSNRLRTFQIPKDLKIELVVQTLLKLSEVGSVYLLEELHREGSAPSACAAVF